MLRRILIALGVTCVALVAVANWPRNDRSLSTALAGTWRATDTDNAALHGHKDRVIHEEATFDAQGQATYRIGLESPQAQVPVTSWGWKVEHGKLLLKDIGPDSTQEWMRPLRFSAGRNTLTLHRKGSPAKEFARVSN